MGRQLFLLFIFTALLCQTAVVSAQQAGQIRGMIRDKDFEAPLALAEVTIAELQRTVTATDLGNYVFDNVPPGTYTLIFTKPGYMRQIEPEVIVTAGQSTEINAELGGEFVDMDPFVVEDLQVEAGTQDEALKLRFESPAFVDTVSAEMMSQAGAGDVASALKLAAGATVADGKYAVVRGLPDRYVNSQMNSVRLPSADPDKRAVQLDQFPSAVVESVRVTKTFTPDQQGDASGGAVNIILKGIPSENILKFSTSYSYNTQFSGRDDFMTYRGGGVGLLGQEADSRKIQWDNLGDVWDGAVGVTRDDAPIDYKWSLTAGGKHDFDGITVGGLANLFYETDSSFHDNGIDDSWWVRDIGGPMVPQTSGEPGQGNAYTTKFFDVTEGSEEVKWGGLASGGVEVENHKLNLIYMYTRVTEDVARLAEDTRGKQYFFPGYDHKSQFAHFLAGSIATDEAPFLRSEALEYTERETQTIQFNGQHTFEVPEWGVRKVFKILSPELDWTYALSNSSMYQPDKRLLSTLWWARRADTSSFPFIFDPAEFRPWKAGTDFLLGNEQRIWKDITENSTQYFVNLKFPFEQWTGTTGYVKFGYFDDVVDRTYNQESFSNFATATYDLNAQRYEAEWEEFWSEVWPSQDHELSQAVDIDVDYTGGQKIHAWYWMVDLPLTSFFKMVGGFRYESTELNIVLDPGDDASWLPPGAPGAVQLNPGDADVFYTQYDVLPSIGFEFKPLESITLRGSYTETVARQTFKELTPVQQQEFLGGDIFVGNPSLLMSALRNYDLRFDYAPFAGSLVSVAWFKKDITDPIETVQRSAGFTFTTPVNYPEGELTGYEFEVRQNLGKFWEPLQGLTVGGNLTLIDSEVQLPPEETLKLTTVGAPITSRDMTNAPEHLYNLYLTYDLERFGTKFGIFYTVRGDTLVAGDGNSGNEYIPAVYETEYDTLNVSVSQKIGKYFTLKFAAKNLTNPEIQRVYRSDFIDGDVLRTSYTKGIEYSFGISATIPF